ncbi:MAG: signal peptidase I [Oscillospiraceae bacterium]|nr:signal peptidase I [Oscillospiraceae bacterium]MCL2278095.1 signal peptidase I [Oscillospiraceae bacterium]
MSNVSSEMSVEQSHEEKAAKMRMELYDWIQTVLTALIVGVMLFIFVGNNISVDGISMERTLIHGDRVIISNLFYTPSNGDVIVFHSPTERFDGIPLVKRIIAVPGQEIDIDFDNSRVYVDGVLLDEPYAHTTTTDRYNFMGPITIPDGYVFVLGDHRVNSIDSRCNSIGLVDDRYILGRVLMIMIPGIDRTGTRDWSRFGTLG